MNNTVYLCDCMDYMKGLPDNAFDLAIVDPPYGIGSFSMPTTTTHNHIRGKKAKWSIDWNDKIPEHKYFKELGRISVNQIIWGANYYNCFNPGGALVWYKDNPHPDMSDCEIASLSMFQKVDFIRLDWSNTDKYNKLRGADIHPCQKPVGLYAWILRKYAKPGQSIFDSHVGSGSIRIACHDMAYDFTGCELDPDYHAAQEDRFNTHKAQGQLFDPVELTKNEYVQVAL